VSILNRLKKLESIEQIESAFCTQSSVLCSSVVSSPSGLLPLALGEVKFRDYRCVVAGLVKGSRFLIYPTVGAKFGERRRSPYMLNSKPAAIRSLREFFAPIINDIGQDFNKNLKV